MAGVTANTDGPLVVSTLSLRSNLGSILRRMEAERRSLVIEKWFAPAAVLLSVRTYVKLAAPETEILKIIGDEARRNKTSSLTSRQIEQIIAATRSEKKRR